MQYVYEAVLFVPYYTVHAVRTTLYRQRPASPGHGQPCPGGSQPAQAMASQAMARRLAIQPRQRPAAHLYMCFKGLRVK